MQLLKDPISNIRTNGRYRLVHREPEPALVPLEFA
jgi:hypothetical protein